MDSQADGFKSSSGRVQFLFVAIVYVYVLQNIIIIIIIISLRCSSGICPGAHVVQFLY
jgi:hypothetical protein